MDLLNKNAPSQTEQNSIDNSKSKAVGVQTGARTPKLASSISSKFMPQVCDVCKRCTKTGECKQKSQFENNRVSSTHKKLKTNSCKAPCKGTTECKSENIEPANVPLSKNSPKEEPAPESTGSTDNPAETKSTANKNDLNAEKGAPGTKRPTGKEDDGLISLKENMKSPKAKVSFTEISTKSSTESAKISPPTKGNVAFSESTSTPGATSTASTPAGKPGSPSSHSTNDKFMIDSSQSLASSKSEPAKK